MDLVTVDGSTSVDLDDALWVRRAGDGHVVTVAVSDVAAAVAAGSPEDAAALGKGFTVYRATMAVTPMLPSEISEDRASLIAGSPRAALVVEITLDAGLDPVDVAVSRREIVVSRRLDHAGALDAARTDDAVGGMLRCAFALAQALQAKRRAAGAMTFSNVERGLVMNEEGKVLYLGRSAHAYVLVQEMMIMANAALATRMAERGLPILYRNHRARVTANRQSLVEDADLVGGGLMDATTFEMRRNLVMDRATIDATISGHFGLNLPVYAWFTSPIRRYADLVNHRILFADLDGRPAPYDMEALTGIARRLNGLYQEERDQIGGAYKKWALDKGAEAARSDPQEMDRVTFTQAVKAVASGADLGRPVMEEMKRRSSAGMLTPKDVFRLFAAQGLLADEAKALAVAHLTARPESAAGFLIFAQSAADWRVSETAVSVAGTSDLPLFTASMTLGVDGGIFFAECVARQKKAAMQRAMAGAVILSAGSPLPTEWTSVPAPATAKANPPAAQGTKPKLPPKVGAEGGNAKGDLIAVCLARGWSPPEFESVRSGPPHAAVFACTVLVRTRPGQEMTAVASAGTRRGAEVAASGELLEKVAVRQPSAESVAG